MVESAIALPIFLFCVLTSLDLLRIAYTSLSLQFIATHVMREASTAQLSDNQIAQLTVDTAKALAVSIEPATDLRMCPMRMYPHDCHTFGNGMVQGSEAEMIALHLQTEARGFVIGPALYKLLQRTIQLDALVVMRREPND